MGATSAVVPCERRRACLRLRADCSVSPSRVFSLRVVAQSRIGVWLGGPRNTCRTHGAQCRTARGPSQLGQHLAELRWHRRRDRGGGDTMLERWSWARLSREPHLNSPFGFSQRVCLIVFTQCSLLAPTHAWAGANIYCYLCVHDRVHCLVDDLWRRVGSPPPVE